ncbi:hypothetical protein ASC80_06280 [Afipia sp. Root123D2]|uniref:hypothetical protein n=1 Tax=Afipia sp. Root123D2 TaxID=1736436 RepID=UPI0007014E06|nr:hypothetical protein [Afipia sp. Root123D2]KQW22932.1 hypothetical protein ASC80_06280 [Afipia sp. Root123D2]
MSHQYRDDTPNSHAFQISVLIAEMERTVELLGEGIAASETQANVFDRTAIAYPPLARSLWERQTKLRQTISDLRRRIPAPVVEEA